MSRRGNPFDNAKAESFIKTQKEAVRTTRRSRRRKSVPTYPDSGGGSGGVARTSRRSTHPRTVVHPLDIRASLNQHCSGAAFRAARSSALRRYAVRDTALRRVTESGIFAWPWATPPLAPTRVSSIGDPARRKAAREATAAIGGDPTERRRDRAVL